MSGKSRIDGILWGLTWIVLPLLALAFVLHILAAVVLVRERLAHVL